MELDDLKGVWRQQTQQSAKESLSVEALLVMLHSKATNTIDLLKRSVRFELCFTVLFILACLAYSLISLDESIRYIALIISIISCGFGLYYFKKLLLLNRLTIGNTSIKENLTTLIIRFEKFLWFYRWGYNILIPMALFIGVAMGLQVSTENDFVQLASQPKLWIMLIIILAPIAILFNFGIKWYLRKLYGRHLSNLKSLLKDLQD